MEGGAYNWHELWLHAWYSNCEITDIIYRAGTAVMSCSLFIVSICMYNNNIN